MSAKKKSISGPSELFDEAELRCKSLGYATFSDYVQALMRADVLKGEASHVREFVPPLTASNSEGVGREIEQAAQEIVKNVAGAVAKQVPSTEEKSPAASRPKAKVSQKKIHLRSGAKPPPHLSPADS